MIEQVKALATKPDDLSSSKYTHVHMVYVGGLDNTQWICF